MGHAEEDNPLEEAEQQGRSNLDPLMTTWIGATYLPKTTHEK